MSISAQEQEINIKNLVLEEPKSEKPTKFNSYKYVTRREWDVLIRKLDEERKNFSWNDFVGIASALRVLFPDRVNQLGLDDLAWQKAKEYLEAVRQNSPSIYWRNATEVAILFPERIYQLYEDNQNQDVMQSNLEVAIGNSFISGQFGEYVKREVAVRYVFPNPNKLVEHNISDLIVQELKEYLDGKRGEDDWAGYVDMVRDMRLLLPDSKNLIDQEYVLSQADRILIFLRERDSWFRYVGLVKDFAIINAQTVEFSNQGLTLTTTSGFSVEENKIPERRRF